jgi:zinc protease
LVWSVLGRPALADAPRPPAPSDPVASARLPEDPRIHRGVLANGLRYAVMHSDRPAGGLSIRLAVNVGSYDEADTERGYAHLIEHMAFRSTRDFPGNSVDGLFTGQGVRFGRDLNAETQLLSTRFQLDLPKATDTGVALGLKWLRDIADGVVFNTDDLDKERGVVLAEKESTNSADEQADEAVAKFQAPDSRSTARNPIGLEDVLRGATPETLHAFYARWYRPDNAVVVLVGDLPTDVLEAKVRAAFESWRGVGLAPARAARTPPAGGRGLETFSVAKAVAVDQIAACRLSAADPDTSADISAMRRHALDDIWREALNRRLAALRSDPVNMVVGSSIGVDDNGGDLRKTCLEVVPTAGGWATALRAAQRELRRFGESGPTDQELDTATDNVRSRVRGDVTDAPNRTASDLADEIAETGLNGGVVADPRQYLAAFDQAVEAVSIADVRAAFARNWSGPGPLISAEAAAPPSPQSLRDVWASTEQGGALTAFVDRKGPEWGYSFGKPGKVVSRQIVQTGDFVRIHFDNGLLLNFKKTTFEKDNVELVVTFGAGRKEIAGKDYFAAVLGGGLFALGGVGKHDVQEIQSMFQSEPHSFEMIVGDREFLIAKRVSRPNLEDQIGVLTAYMSDPGFRPSADPAVRLGLNAAYRLFETTPRMSAEAALTQAVMPDSPLTLPPKATADALDEAYFAKLLKPAITRDPIAITMAGDIDEKTAIDLIGSTFGALPARTTPPPVRADTVYLRFPDTAPGTLRVTHHGPEDKAVAQAVWPLYVATRARRHEEFSIRLLAAIFNDELRRRVRVELGKSYAPSVGSTMPDDANQGELVAQVESHPADIDAMMSEIRAAAARLRDGQVTQQDLDAARIPLLAKNREAMATNSHWAIGLALSGQDDQSLKDFLSLEEMVGSISLQDIKKAAADWLSRDPWTVIVEPAKPRDAAHP